MHVVRHDKTLRAARVPAPIRYTRLFHLDFFTWKGVVEPTKSVEVTMDIERFILSGRVNCHIWDQQLPEHTIICIFLIVIGGKKVIITAVQVNKRKCTLANT